MSNASKVYYPFAGKRILLLWHTQNDGTHMLIGNNLPFVQKTANYLNDKYSPRFVNLLEVELVAPSDAFCNRFDQLELEENVNHFYYSVTYSLRDAVEKNLTLPKFFSVCKKSCDAFDCDSCDQGFNLVGITKVQLYSSFHEKWARANGQERYMSLDKRRKPSQARKAKDDEIFCVAQGSGSIGLYSLEDQDSMYHSPLFYYKQIQEFTDVLHDMQDECKRREDAEKAKYHEMFSQREELWEQRKLSELQNFLALFS